MSDQKPDQKTSESRQRKNSSSRTGSTSTKKTSESVETKVAADAEKSATGAVASPAKEQKQTATPAVKVETKEDDKPDLQHLDPVTPVLIESEKPEIIGFTARLNQYIVGIRKASGDVAVIKRHQRTWMRALNQAMATPDRKLAKEIFAILMDTMGNKNFQDIFGMRVRNAGMVASDMLSENEATGYSRLNDLLCSLATSKSRFSMAKDQDLGGISKPLNLVKNGSGDMVVSNLKHCLNIK